MRYNLSRARIAAALALVAASTVPAFGQVDPLLFMKTQVPNVVFVVDTANRMQRDAPTDNSTATTYQTTSNYYDPTIYSYSAANAAWEALLGATAANTTSTYRRKYVGLNYSNAGNGDKFDVTTIQVVGDQDAGNYARFGAPTRLSIARAAMYQAVNENKNVARFGLIKMRQKTPTAAPSPATSGNSGPVADADVGPPGQQGPTENGSVVGKWTISRPTVANGQNNGAQSAPNPVTMVKADSDTAQTLLDILTTDVRGTQTAAGRPTVTGLIPAGNDDATTKDTPVKLMLDDAYAEAKRLIAINSDPTCRNTVVVLIVGGGEGNSTAGADNSTLATVAATFLNLNGSGRRVPIHVIALAPVASDSAALSAIATSSGGRYTEITKAQIDTALNSTMQQATVGVTAPAGALIVPEVVKAISIAVQNTFATSTDFNANLPAAFGNTSEFQVTSPIIGTVNLNQATDINGTLLPSPQPPDVKDKQGSVIPQRNNVMLTTGVLMPGFDASLRAFRVYKPLADSTQPSGYKFVSDGTRLWVGKTPADPNQRNLFTSTSGGTLIAFNTDPVNLSTLASLMNVNTTDATTIINAFRSLPLGAVIDSTPAIMNPPSLDPPPDDSYPGFAVANKNRRTLIWAGTNRGILEAIDARSGLELWGFIPLNLLPKLRTLLDGQPVGKFDYFMDGSPKISDVRLTGICSNDHPELCWRTHLIVGEGPGGTFYQSFDVTLDDMTIAPDSNDTAALLAYFSTPTRIKLNWSFPSYSHFDVCAPLTSPCSPIATSGDLHATNATAIEKTVGQTWSDPAVGEVVSNSGPYSVLLGSGFLPYSVQHQSNRGDKVAGTTFYILDAKTGTVFTTSDVGSDGKNEVNAPGTTSADDCTTAAVGCKQIKNALQTDPVATGPSDQRFITKAYIGDLDGRVWRFDIGLDGSLNPKVNTTTKLFESGDDQPIFSSMATVNVGGTNQYIFFGTGSDLLPSTDKNTVYRLLGVLDTGAATGSKSLEILLQKSTSLDVDEKVTAFPAVAGDIVFFTTTTFNSKTACSAPTANLFGLTFIGGAAYDTNNDGKFDRNDKTLVTSIAGQRATAPFIVDQHLVFGTQGKVSVFGDSTDFNNGIGQAGVRILSWREVR